MLKFFKAVIRRPVFLVVPALCFLAFVAGAFVTEFRWFPYAFVFQDAFTYIRATAERRNEEGEAMAEAERGAAKPTGDVTIKATPQAFDGYTFLTYETGRPSTARLIDMDGKVVHEWHRPMRDIWKKPPHKSNPSPETSVAWRYGELFPNGDIIVVLVGYGDTPNGYGLVKLDKDSNVIWQLAENFHHHFSIAEDGRIFGMTHDWRDAKKGRVKGARRLPGKVLEDFIVEVSPDGKVLSRTSLTEAMAAPGFRDLMSSAFFNGYWTNPWDPLHPNDVEVITADFAAKHPSIMKAGSVLVSLRDLDALVLLDPKTKQVTWSQRGPWLRQHDPDLLDNGNILVFDNRGDRTAKRGGSRLIEWEPETGKVAWSYLGTDDHPFLSSKNAAVERLPNGNTLVTEDDNGRVFEVTKAGEIVWEYRDVRMHQASRVTRDWIKFAPGGPVKAPVAAAETHR